MPRKRLAKHVSLRISSLISLLDETLPLWDLCSDHGQIGMLALETSKVSAVTFVEIRGHILSQLSANIENHALQRHSITLLHSDILLMPLPAHPVNFVIAGVGTNLIIDFLSRLKKRKGDRIICNTHQNPDLFDMKLHSLGFVASQKIVLTVEKPKTQTIWAIQL